ncbi:hypothetical protein [Dyadobacter luteus]|nr:hypothetical protein [Dyadobacter luteus]
MKSIFKNTIIVAALVFGAASVSNAQVKVGSNPAAIGTSSNLEVEATNGNKTIVDKATGKVTIQDGTQGAGKVLTSDANGASSWQPSIPASQDAEVMLSAKLTTTQSLPYSGGGIITKVNFDTELFDKGNNFDLTNDQLTAPTSGYYSVNVGFSRSGTASNSISAFIYVNNVESGQGNLWDGGIPASAGYTASASRMVHLNAGDVLDVRFRPNFAADGISTAFLQIAKVSN